MARPFFRYTLIWLTAFVLCACAQPGKLTGGDKDVTPPKIVSSKPQIGAVNFKGTAIHMMFDEYVDISGAAKELVVTPPFKNAPRFTQRNKEVIIGWEEALLDSTTYVFNFGEGIVDVNERNPLDSNVFVFSTGSYIDSLSVEGRVVDAFTLQPVKDVTVMLYGRNIDSLPLTSLPRYFGKTNEQGVYHIDYLSAARFKVFALETGNTGYTFDLPIERVAFLNHLVQSKVSTDTTHETIEDLRLFLHADTVQYIKEKKQLFDKGISFVFNLPVEAFALNEINGKDISEWIEVWSETKDSLTYWFPEVDDYDSLDLQIAMNGLMDTVRFYQPSKFAKPAKNEKAPAVKLRVKGGKIKYFDALHLVTDRPFGHVDLSSGLLISGMDSMPLEPLVTMRNLGMEIRHTWEEGKTYKFFLRDSALCDRYGVCNDTIRLSATVTSKTDYGELVMHHELPSEASSFIWQLLNGEGKTLKERLIHPAESVKLLNLPVGKYQVRLIFDENGNGQWDPGDYRAKIYPERVVFYDQTIDIKANWVEEIDWKVSP
ncbi:MAG: Ig-like domain-containing protein [Cryomorphaceae bacterium]